MTEGLLCLLFFFFWLFHLRKMPYYGSSKDEYEIDKYVSEKTWEANEKYHNWKLGILAILILIFGLSSIYNDLAGYFSWIRLY